MYKEKIHRLYSPRLNKLVRIRVYLPPSYDGKRKYPVLYMHDGQNAVRPARWSHESWKVTETLEKMRLPLIVVGVDSDADRSATLSPWKSEIEDKEIYRIVEKCKEIGLKCVTDGDYKSTNYTDFFHHLENISKLETPQPEEPNESVVSGKIDFDNSFLSTPPVTQRFTYLTGNIGGDMYDKALIPSPTTLLAELLRPENRYNTGRYYPDIELLVHDIAQTYQKVINEFYDMGCRFLQLTDYAWNLTGDSNIEQVAQAAHLDLHSLIATSAQLTEACLAQKPDDMCISLQFRNPWWKVGDKEKMAELLFSTRADAIALEFGNRENENIDFSILNYCQGKEVILGLISTTSLQPISTSNIILHIENAARLIPLESLHLSSQGDFRDNLGNSVISEQMMWSKIVTMKNIAKTVWGK